MRPSVVIHLALVLLLCGVARPARATTLAVLPLERGAKSETHDGLGQALAGMLDADLSHADGLVLVERARLDAVLGEIALGRSGYLDPTTAQKVGKGVGAELVLVGDWSVLDGKFLLDARAVDVAHGTVRTAVAANGSVQDFVSVEKQLVTELIDGLDLTVSASDRRKIWTETPTERFDAFVAYSEGLHAEDKGAWDDARAAYKRALAKDPQFMSAQEALSGLRATLQASKAAASSSSAAAVKAVLAAVPDERSRPRHQTPDNASRAAFALREMALENAGRSCDRFGEMLAFGEHTKWDVALPYDARAAFRDLVAKTGFAAIPPDVSAPKAAHAPPSSRLSVFDDLHHYLTGDEWFSHPQDGSGMLGDAVRCFAPDQRVAAIDRVRAALARAGHADDVPDREDLSLDEDLVLTAAYQRATWLGPDAVLTARMKGLLAAHPDSAAHSEVQEDIDQVMRQATQWEDHQVRRQGRSPAVLERVERALANRDAKVLVVDDPRCSEVERAMLPGASAWVARLPEAKGDPITSGIAWDTAGGAFAILASLGCVRGLPPRFPDDDHLASFLRAGLAKMDDAKKHSSDCAMSVAMLEQMLQPQAVARARAAPGGAAMWAYQVLLVWYRSLQFSRCVDDRVP